MPLQASTGVAVLIQRKEKQTPPAVVQGVAPDSKPRIVEQGARHPLDGPIHRILPSMYTRVVKFMCKADTGRWFDALAELRFEIAHLLDITRETVE